MKKILAVVAMLFVAATASAQFSVNIGPGVSIPMGDFSKAEGGLNGGIGFGGALGFQYSVSPTVRVGLELGVYSHGENTKFEGQKYTYTNIPIMATFQYAFAEEGFMPYIGAGVGYLSLSQKRTILNVEETGTATGFAFAPIAGFRYGFSEKAGLDFNVRYVIASVKSSESGSSSTSVPNLPINVGVYINFGSN